MKIQKISLINFNNSERQNHFAENSVIQKTLNTHKKKAAAVITGAAVIAAVYYAVKSPKKAVETIQNHFEKPINSYRKSLAEALSSRLNKIVKAEDIECVLDKKQFLEELSTLNRQNYVFNPKNIDNGIFRADLHSHSTYSDGKITVKELMEQAGDYSQKLYEKNGKKLLFALTDHDGIEGVKEALEIIAQNPKKFKYLKFVTGSEISYAHQSTATTNPCETSELLTYCFNPFSENINKFFNRIKEKRTNMVMNYIKDLQKYFPETNFSIKEFKEIYNPEEAFLMNIHWKVYHYAQTKKAVADIAKEHNKNPEKMYRDIMKKAGKEKTLYDLIQKNLLSDFTDDNILIHELNKKYYPTYNGKVNTVSENTIEEIFDVFSKDKETVMGFAHPFYMTERLFDVKSFADELIKKSKGLIKLTESWHQDYKGNIPAEKITQINQIIENFGLIPIGGRDNHKNIWLLQNIT